MHERFKIWAGLNGINIDHPDDFYPWWECWLDGYKVGHEEQAVSKDADREMIGDDADFIEDVGNK